jgi:hypothetical protein
VPSQAIDPQREKPISTFVLDISSETISYPLSVPENTALGAVVLGCCSGVVLVAIGCFRPAFLRVYGTLFGVREFHGIGSKFNQISANLHLLSKPEARHGHCSAQGGSRALDFREKPMMARFHASLLRQDSFFLGTMIYRSTATLHSAWQACGGGEATRDPVPVGDIIIGAQQAGFGFA